MKTNTPALKTQIRHALRACHAPMLRQEFRALLAGARLAGADVYLRLALWAQGREYSTVAACLEKLARVAR